MMTKTAYYMQMAQEAAAQITGSKEQWTAFLTTSARLYKYPFAEQLMIYKQRPEATACAEYDLWNDRMNRYVKRGSKGIALLDMRGEQPKLRYVFDVADTGERKNSRPVQLWKMNAEHEQPIIRALDTAFDVSAGAGSLENHIMEAAERLAREYWEEKRRQISDIVADSYLEGYDELNIGASFKRAAAVSIAYSVFTRTVGNADGYFEHEDFLDIFDFNTQAAANVLGTAVSEMSSQIFPAEIEKTQGFIKGFQSDIRTVAAHPLPEEGFCGMEVNATRFTEKAEAGEAILAVCKANQSLEPVPLGNYRGFKMELAFDSFQKEYQVLLKGEMTHRVLIGTSAAGNIQRLDNALAGIPAKLEKAEQQLDSLRSQQEAAQAELGKPFPQEAELTEKSARLAELDALLNMDDRGNDDPDCERTTEKPSVLAELRDRAGRIPPMTHRDEEVAL